MSATPENAPAPTAMWIIPHTHWDREWYEPHDVFRARLSEIISKRIKQKGKTTTVLEEASEPQEGAATNVVDFVALLQKSLGKKGDTAAGSKPATKKAPAKAAAKKATTKKNTTNKSTAATKKPSKKG